MYVTASPGNVFGGGKKVFYSLISGLNRNVFEPVVACSPHGLYADLLSKADIPVRPFTVNSQYNLWKVFQLARLMREEAVQVMHSQGGGRSNFFALLSATLAKVPIKIVSVATLVERWADVSASRRAGYIAVDRVLERFVDQFVCVSEEVRQAIINTHKVMPSKAVTIHNGIATESLRCQKSHEEIYEKLNIPRNKTIISLIGRLVWVKGVNFLLQAAANLSKKYTDIHFLIVGDGPLKNTLEQQANNLGINDKCSFIGFQEDIPAILKITDILVLSSHIEGLPMVILEAMASGIPVVASAVGGIPEVVEDGKTGFLVQPGNPYSLSEKLAELIIDKNLRERMGESGKLKVEKSFSESVMIQETEHVYLNMIKAKGL